MNQHQTKTDLSKAELNAILDIIHTSLGCNTVSGFEQILEQIKELIPFSYARCGLGDNRELRAKGMAVFKSISDFPREWEHRYSRKNYVMEDAVAIIAYRKKGLRYWADCLRFHAKTTNDIGKARIILDEAASIGLKAGWIYSLEGRRTSECAVISLAGDRLERDVRSETIIRHLGPHLGQVVKRIILGQTENSFQLTPRENEVLSWAAAGKTAWETSQILNISQRTVEFHMGNILTKLDAANVQQAVAIAAFTGLISY